MFFIFQLNVVVNIKILIWIALCVMIINNESTLGHSFNQGLNVKYTIVSNEVYSTLIGSAPSFHFSNIWLTRREKGND